MIHDPLKARSEYDDKTREELLEQLISLQERLGKQKADLDRCSEETSSLRESEKKYRFLVENSKDIIWQIDLQCRWTFVSSNVRSILGYEQDQVIGKDIWDFIAPEYHDIVKKNIKLRLMGEERPPYEVEIVAKDGHYVPFELMASVVMNKTGVITGIQGISRDIAARKQSEERLKRSYEELETRVRERTLELTRANKKLQEEIEERRLTEEALRESEANLARAQEIAHLGSWSWDLATNVVYWSDELYRIFGVEKSGFVPSYDAYIEATHPDDRELANAVLMDTLNERKPHSVEHRIVLPDGTIRWIVVDAKAILDKHGKPTHLFGTAHDIMERKRTEEALSDAKAQAELYLDLMGHDINNLNQVALGFLELADDTIKSGSRLGEDNKELIEKAMVSLNSSTKLIDKVMKLRRLKTRELRLEQVDVCRVLAKVKNRYSHVAGRDVTINYVPPMECLVMANELIDEIFINLIENSIKHSPTDRPLVIDIQQTRVCEGGEEFSRISVEDNGPGIADNVKERLFTRFYRGRTLAKGKGLGLYLVKTLVENFGGKVRVEDRIPDDHTKGSKFVVMLPSVD